MGKVIEIRLSDAQHAALSAEAEASGHRFFEYCRIKLTTENQALSYGTSPMASDLAVVKADNERKLIQARLREAERLPPPMIVENDRISRIEDAVARLTDYVLKGHAPTEMPAQPAAPVDIDAMVAASFQEAEAQGLTEHVPDEAETELQTSGVRPLSRRPVPFSPATVSRHLQQIG